MSGRFDAATDPTERALSQLKDAIRGEAGNPTSPEGSTQPRDNRSPRKVETVLVVVAASVMISVFILLILWLR